MKKVCFVALMLFVCLLFVECSYDDESTEDIEEYEIVYEDDEYVVGYKDIREEEDFDVDINSFLYYCYEYTYTDDYGDRGKTEIIYPENEENYYVLAFEFPKPLNNGWALFPELIKLKVKSNVSSSIIDEETLLVINGINAFQGKYYDDYFEIKKSCGSVLSVYRTGLVKLTKTSYDDSVEEYVFRPIPQIQLDFDNDYFYSSVFENIKKNHIYFGKEYYEFETQ